jgi:hypothetical protein
VFTLLWRFVPGPAWVRVIVLFVAAAALVFVMINYVYPWAATLLPNPEESTVDS